MPHAWRHTAEHFNVHKISKKLASGFEAEKHAVKFLQNKYYSYYTFILTLFFKA
jgi:hypothetical protein